MNDRVIENTEYYVYHHGDEYHVMADRLDDGNISVARCFMNGKEIFFEDLEDDLRRIIEDKGKRLFEY